MYDLSCFQSRLPSFRQNAFGVRKPLIDAVSASKGARTHQKHSSEIEGRQKRVNEGSAHTKSEKLRQNGCQ